MDYFDCENNCQKPPSHYEYVSPVNCVRNPDRVKKEAFAMMNELEGWCSTYKAGLLIDFVLSKKPKTIVEIGVFGGKSLVPMAAALRELGRGKIYGIDPWDANESIIGMDGANKDFWKAVDHQKILRDLVFKIKKFGLEPHVELVKATSADAAPIPHIEMLHIDGNHSEETSYLDVTKWVPCVVDGGLIIFDDITWGAGVPTTQKAVNWLNANCKKFSEFDDNCRWGVWIK